MKKKKKENAKRRKRQCRKTIKEIQKFKPQLLKNLSKNIGKSIPKARRSSPNAGKSVHGAF